MSFLCSKNEMVGIPLHVEEGKSLVYIKCCETTQPDFNQVKLVWFCQLETYCTTQSLSNSFCATGLEAKATMQINTMQNTERQRRRERMKERMHACSICLDKSEDEELFLLRV